MRDKPILSEKTLHNEYFRKASIEKKISGRGSQGAWRQHELIGSNRQSESNFDFDFGVTSLVS
jgi:hypothetical protein